ncbi:hypothetical protein SESBI_40887 [Sesbania bispinosa]|nr:hypothetical protein SESBI_40887 [Sesbania bispinosa]
MSITLQFHCKGVVYEVDLDLDVWSYFEARDLVKESGVVSNFKLWWNLNANSDVGGWKTLTEDKEASDLATATRENVGEAHIFVEIANGIQSGGTGYGATTTMGYSSGDSVRGVHFDDNEEERIASQNGQRVQRNANVRTVGTNVEQPIAPSCTTVVPPSSTTVVPPTPTISTVVPNFDPTLSRSKTYTFVMSMTLQYHCKGVVYEVDLDLDVWSYFEARDLVKESGVVSNFKLWWNLDGNFDVGGWKPLTEDKDASNLVTAARENIGEAHIFVEIANRIQSGGTGHGATTTIGEASGMAANGANVEG